LDANNCHFVGSIGVATPAVSSRQTYALPPNWTRSFLVYVTPLCHSPFQVSPAGICIAFMAVLSAAKFAFTSDARAGSPLWKV
jgi:hypothetical protein